MDISENIRIKNEGNTAVSFKIQQIENPVFSVKPKYGTVEPGKIINATIT